MHAVSEIERLVWSFTPGGLFLPDTPNSLVERGHIEKGREVLRRVRGTPDVDVEFSSIMIANKAAQHTENPWRSIGRCASSVPALPLNLITLCGVLPCWSVEDVDPQ